ncbi:MAG TPA: hypothetical protein VFQ01_08840 [Nocardioides sp.]|nr:hypothetical protein [Nocardioides sp.]
MELPQYPASALAPMPDESPTRQLATALLVFEAVALGLSLPIQVFLSLWLGWEGGDEALKHRLLVALPMLGLGGLLAAVLSGVGASVVWRDTGHALVASAAGLVAVLGLGWAVALQGTLVDPLLGPLWLVMTAPAPVALALLLVVRRRSGQVG